MIIRNIKFCLVAIAMAGLLSACVTETSTIYSTEVTEDEAVQSYVDAAQGYLRKGDSENALRHLRKALEVDDKNPAVHASLAYAFQMKGEMKLAEKHYKTSLKLDSSQSATRNNYGYFLFTQERYKEAIKQFDLVVADTLYPRRVQAFFLIGQSQLQLGDMDAAEEAFVRAAKLDRLFTPAILELADLNVQKQEFVLAQRYYDNYKALAKQNARSLFIGIQLADYFDDPDDLASYALALKNLYPRSEEYVRYRKEYGNGAE